MSLAQHVTQAEGFDYDPPVVDESSGHHQHQQQTDNGVAWNHGGVLASTDLQPLDNKSEWRRMSFAPAEPAVHAQLPRIPAYKVSNLRRLGE